MVCCGSDSSVARSQQGLTLSPGFGWRGGADPSMRKQPKKTMMETTEIRKHGMPRDPVDGRTR